jgi:GcrA cell cycle regulator
MRGPDSDWPEERTEALKKRWAEGASSYVIAAELNITRGAVMGKVHRLKIHRGCTNTKPKKARVKKKRAKRVKPPRETFTEKHPGDADVLWLAFSRLERNSCRWPSGDPCGTNFSFCCAPTADGRYCAAHTELSIYRREAA